MTVFRVGMRVKYVGECDPGNTGVITEIDILDSDVPVEVQWDYAGPCDVGGFNGAGERAWTDFHLIEPILDQHQPCESEFKESLDRMLEKVVEVVR